MKKQDIIQELTTARPARSAWGRGVQAYAVGLAESLPDDYDTATAGACNLESALLNGAGTWKNYSYGGCYFIYDEDIARRLCSPSELRRVNYGMRNPNGHEGWLDVQARALYQAARLVIRAVTLNK